MILDIFRLNWEKGNKNQNPREKLIEEITA